MSYHHLCKLIDRRSHLVDDVTHYHLHNELPTHKSFVKRLGFRSQLEGHRGCVNCLQWNSDGTLLASGSDDYNVHIWNALEGRSLACMQTGHIGNIFSVKFVPFSGDNLILTGAEDREVRLHDLMSFETIQTWPCCSGRVKRLAVSPHSPFLCWSASEDGCIRQYDTRESHTCGPEGRCRNVLIDLRQTCGSVREQTQCKCLDINSVRTEQIAVGSLDPYIRLFDTRLISLSYPCTEVSTRADPSCLAHFGPGHVTRDTGRHHRHTIAATYVTFSPCGQQLLASLSGEQVYLYSTVTLEPLFHYNMEDDEPSLVQLPPFCPLLSSHDQSCDHSPHQAGVQESDVPLLAKRLRDSGNQCYQKQFYTEAIQHYSSGLTHCPHWYILYSNRATALISRNWSGDLYEALRDTERALSFCPSHQKSLRRRIKCLRSLRWLKEAQSFLDDYQCHYPEDEDFIRSTATNIERVSNEQQGRNGYHSGHRRELSLWETERQATAYDYHQRYIGHCNTHTDIKEASFLGERGNYIAAGSDDGNVFIWEKDSANLVRVLHADDSIVNCIQWHPRTSLLATSGIESTIRLWEPRPPDDTVRIENDMIRACQHNQTRMSMDPFEIMLMGMGLRMTDDPPIQLDNQHIMIQTREEYFLPRNTPQCRQS